jgi:polyisoprenoid-binding protein YceI
MRPRALGAWLLAATGAAGAAPVDYQLTPTHSFVHFEWTHAGLSTLRGRFDKVSGRVTLDRASRQGRGHIGVRLDSVNTGRPALDAALRRALGAEGEATAQLDLTAMRFVGDRPSAVAGRLRGPSPDRPLDLPLELQAAHFNCYLNPLLRREVCGGEFEATVEPAALGLVIDPSFGLAGPIRLRVQVEAIRQEDTP